MATDTQQEETAALLQQLATTTVSEARAAVTREAPRLMRAPGFDWQHEVRVMLPASYHSTARTYPVLWVTDMYLELASAVLGSLPQTKSIPEHILVNVGPDPAATILEAAQRRVFDFTPGTDLSYDGPGGRAMKAQIDAGVAAGMPAQAGGGAGRFLDFLIDEVRPALAADYRMDPDNHVLFGHSGGGMFAGFAIFARPEAFSGYIIGSPSLNASNETIFEMEEQYAASHQDLRARIFFGGGDREIVDVAGGMWSLIGSAVRLAETLALRSYPSIRVAVKIFPDEDHLSVVPSLLIHGTRHVWSS